MPCCTPRRAQARPRGLGIRTAGPAGTTRQFQESRAQPSLPAPFPSSQGRAAPETGSPTSQTLTLTLPCRACCYHESLDTRPLHSEPHQAGDTPTIKTSAPQERCSPDYFHVLIGAERQHFRFTRCKSQESQSLSTNEAGRHMSF